MTRRHKQKIKPVKAWMSVKNYQLLAGTCSLIRAAWSSDGYIRIRVLITPITPKRKAKK